MKTVICVGAVVRHRGRILPARQPPGHPPAGQWTVPWGRLSPIQSDATNPLQDGGTYL